MPSDFPSKYPTATDPSSSPTNAPTAPIYILKQKQKFGYAGKCHEILLEVKIANVRAIDVRSIGDYGIDIEVAAAEGCDVRSKSAIVSFVVTFLVDREEKMNAVSAIIESEDYRNLLEQEIDELNLQTRSRENIKKGKYSDEVIEFFRAAFVHNGEIDCM